MKRFGPWLVPCCVGGVLRVIAALSGFGWFAPDDYEFAIQQGGDWLADPSVPFVSPIRSPLLSQLFWGLLRAARAIGVRDPAALLQAAYLVLGLVSVLAIPAVWHLTRRRLGEAAAQQAAWLTAAYALMPRISTRALIEVLAIPPLVWALVALDGACVGRASRRWVRGLTAGMLLGAATLLRFQLGILFVAAAAFVLLESKPKRLALPALSGLLVGGGLLAMCQAAVDASLGRAPFETIGNYLAFNRANADSYGTSAWYVYLGHFALYSLPPATLILLAPLWRAARLHRAVALTLGLFVTVHACIGHKEDRFMYSVLPLFFVLLGSALAQVRRQRPWGVRGYTWFWSVNLAALCVIIFSDAQRNLTVPLLHIARQPGPQKLAAIGYSSLPRYYAGAATRIQFYPDVPTFLRAQGTVPAPNWIIMRHVEQAPQLATTIPQCGATTRYDGDFSDRLLVKMNPRHNGRRAPTALLKCEEI